MCMPGPRVGSSAITCAVDGRLVPVRSRWVLVIATVATVALVVVLVVLVAAEDPPPSARELLDRTQAFVDDAETVEYRGASAFSVEEGDESEGGLFSFTERVTFEVGAELPDRARLVATSAFDGEGFVSEAVYVDDHVYTREAADEDGLDDEMWLLDDEYAAVAFGATIAPLDLAGVIDDVSAPRVLARARGRVLLRVGVDFADVVPDQLSVSYGEISPVAGAARPVVVEPDGPMDLIVTEDGRLEALRVSVVAAYGLTTAMRIEFTSWNGDVEIDEPDEDDVDETPGIDEEVIADYDDTALYQPVALPEGWLLDTAYILGEDETTSGCEEVNTFFADEEYLDPQSNVFEGYLDIYQFPVTCLNGDLGDGDPFVAGQYTGVVTELEDGSYEVVRILVGETVVEVDTDLSLEDLAVILAELEPLDVESPPPDTLDL